MGRKIKGDLTCQTKKFSSLVSANESWKSWTSYKLLGIKMEKIGQKKIWNQGKRKWKSNNIVCFAGLAKKKCENPVEWDFAGNGCSSTMG